MLNESKIKMMTKMAAYEKHEGREDIAICRYFKSDYVSLGVLKTGIAITLAYLVCAALYFVCHIDEYLRNLANLDFNGIVVGLGKYYIITLIIFSVMAFVIYYVRYEKAKKNIRAYEKRLKKLEKFYKNEERNKER